MFNLDKISFVLCFPFLSYDKPMKHKGQYMKLGERQEYFLNFLESSEFVEASYGSSKGYEFHSKMKGGFDLQAICRMKITKTIKKKTISSCPIVADTPAETSTKINYNSIRIEFNPSNIKWGALTGFWKLLCIEFPWISSSDIKFNRIDIACDYRLQIYPYLFWNKSKKYVIFGDENDGTETVYFGTRRSERMLRIYNKRLEQNKKEGRTKKGEWWRIEMTLQPHQGYTVDSAMSISNPFFDLVYINKDGIDYDSISSSSHKSWVRLIVNGAKQSNIIAVINHVLSDSDKKERWRKRELLKSLDTSIPFQMPQELFDLYWRKTWAAFQDNFFKMWPEVNESIRREHQNWFDVYSIVPNDDFQDFK